MDKKLRNINWYDNTYAEGECRGIDEAISIINNLPCAFRYEHDVSDKPFCPRCGGGAEPTKEHSEPELI